MIITRRLYGRETLNPAVGRPTHVSFAFTPTPNICFIRLRVILVAHVFLLIVAKIMHLVLLISAQEVDHREGLHPAQSSAVACLNHW